MERRTENATDGTSRCVKDDLDAMQVGFGAWKDREGHLDGAAWVDHLRSGRRIAKEFELGQS